MSENKPEIISLTNRGSQPSLSLCIGIAKEQIAKSLQESLSSDRYNISLLSCDDQLVNFIEEQKEQIDCLILPNQRSVQPLLSQLYEARILLPLLLLDLCDPTAKDGSRPAIRIEEESSPQPTYLYHSAEVRLAYSDLERIKLAIDRAIARFLKLAPSCNFPRKSNSSELTSEESNDNFLLLQQHRLADKLKERLGYLGVYYKRNPETFFRNLSPTEKQKLLEKIALEYRQIILNYFAHNHQINQQIDSFVNETFFADLSVSQILEIHMNLMDEFAQQLKLEGRSEDILLDYRLTLIDIIAHLCEMYRRSIPREEISFEL
ncbi:MAG: circadian clock protein KaiA [Oscillatoria sp. PMC 1068.18]|nr:circadian clock protein KaiA [Oscillatoria sp. PMC 1076.18]MEC4991080.1 circadian clock protein KaiA [Oscillatoria sp. PMC 1068.18]